MQKIASCVGFTLAAIRRQPLIASRAGAAAVEFAMISLPFLGILAAIFETGADYFRTAQLQMTTELVSRTILTKSAAAGLSNQDFIDEFVCTWEKSGVVKPGTLGRMFDCDSIYLSVYRPSSWSQVSSEAIQINDRQDKIILPGAGEIVVVRIGYHIAPIFPILSGSVFDGFGRNEGGMVTIKGKKGYLLQGVMAFRVEPD